MILFLFIEKRNNRFININKKIIFLQKYLTFLKNLKNANTKYITNIINSEEGLIIRKDRPIEQKKYIILEHCEGGTLIDFVVGNNPGFGELYSK